jgi:urea ABC transporter ATP-binding protein UrtD
MTALMQATAVGKRFGGIVAVDNVSISVDPLEVKCIIGANGAGKSTLFNILCGSAKPDSGSVEFDGEDISRLHLHQFSRIGIARKFQIPSVFDSLTVAQNLMIGLHGPLTAAAARERVDEVLALIGQEALRDELAGNLAHGQKQWLEIGMALIARPRLLLLDEPTAGMTPEETRRTAELILKLAAHTAIVAIEHDMSFVRALACHTYVMHQGKLLVEGLFSDIEQNSLVRDVYLGKA